MRLHHWFACTAALALAMLMSLGASAQVALKGPVRIIVGFAAGGSSDIAARMLSDKLKDSLGVPVIVENKVGAGGRIAGLMIGKATGIEMIHIAYKGGAPLANDLMGGQIPAGVDALSDMIELHRGGKIRIIATSGAQRSLQLPTVPTFKEQGFAAIEGTGWIGVYAPAKTPVAVIDQLSAVFASALKNADLRERFINLGYEPTGTTPEQLSAVMVADTARWGPIIKASGFTGD